MLWRSIPIHQHFEVFRMLCIIVVRRSGPLHPIARMSKNQGSISGR